MIKSEGRRFFLLTSGMTILGVFLFSLVILSLSPYNNNLSESLSNGKSINYLNLLFFYGSLIFLFTGLFSTIFFWLSLRKNFEHNLYLQATTSLRRGFLMALLIFFLLLMQSLRILIWWDALLVAIGIILVEMYLMVR